VSFLPQAPRGAGKKLLAATGGALCLTCHEKVKAASNSKIKHVPFQDGSCTACHDPHGSNYPGVLKDRADRVCYSCHSESEASFLKANTHKPVLDGACNACHKPHGGTRRSFSGRPARNSAVRATGS